MVEKCTNLSVTAEPSNVVVEDFEVYLTGTTTPVSVVNIGERFDMVVYISNNGSTADSVLVQVKSGSDIVAARTISVEPHDPINPLPVEFTDRYFGEVGTYNLCGIASGPGLPTTQKCKMVEAVGEYRLEITQNPVITPTVVEFGNPVTVKVDYKNSGTVDLPASTGRITITANNGNIDQRLIGALAPGEVGSYQIAWTPDEAGTYSVCAIVSYV